jgi:hypothetical protein
MQHPMLPPTQAWVVRHRLCPSASDPHQTRTAAWTITLSPMLRQVTPLCNKIRSAPALSYWKSVYVKLGLGVMFYVKETESSLTVFFLRPLQISPNDQDYSRAFKPFLWFQGVQLVSSLPSVLPHGRPPTNAYIKGQYIRRLLASTSPKCRLGRGNATLPSPNDIIASATWLTPTDIICRFGDAAAAATLAPNQVPTIDSQDPIQTVFNVAPYGVRVSSPVPDEWNQGSAANLQVWKQPNASIVWPPNVGSSVTSPKEGGQLVQIKVVISLPTVPVGAWNSGQLANMSSAQFASLSAANVTSQWSTVTSESINDFIRRRVGWQNEVARSCAWV